MGKNRSCGPCAAAKRSCDRAIRSPCSRCVINGLISSCIVLDDRRSAKKILDPTSAIVGVPTAEYAAHVMKLADSCRTLEPPHSLPSAISLPDLSNYAKDVVLPSPEAVLKAVYSTTNEYGIYSAIPAYVHSGYFENLLKVEKCFSRISLFSNDSNVGEPNSQSQFSSHLTRPYIDHQTLHAFSNSAFSKAFNDPEAVKNRVTLPFRCTFKDELKIYTNEGEKSFDINGSEARNYQISNFTDLITRNNGEIVSRRLDSESVDNAAMENIVTKALTTAVEQITKEEGAGILAAATGTSYGSSIMAVEQVAVTQQASSEPFTPELCSPSSMSVMNDVRHDLVLENVVFNHISNSSVPTMRYFFEDVSLSTLLEAGENITFLSLRHACINSAFCKAVGIPSPPPGKVLHVLGNALSSCFIHPADTFQHHLKLVKNVMTHSLSFNDRYRARFAIGVVNCDVLVKLNYYSSGCLKNVMIMILRAEPDLQARMPELMPFVSLLYPSIDVMKTSDGEYLARIIESPVMTSLRTDPTLSKLRSGIKSLYGSIGGYSDGYNAHTGTVATSSKVPSTSEGGILGFFGLGTSSSTDSTHDAAAGGTPDEAAKARMALQFDEVFIEFIMRTNPSFSKLFSLAKYSIKDRFSRFVKGFGLLGERRVFDFQRNAVVERDSQIRSVSGEGGHGLPSLDPEKISSSENEWNDFPRLGIHVSISEVQYSLVDLVFLPWFRALRYMATLTPQQRRIALQSNAYFFPQDAQGTPPEPGKLADRVPLITPALVEPLGRGDGSVGAWSVPALGTGPKKRGRKPKPKRGRPPKKAASDAPLKDSTPQEADPEAEDDDLDGEEGLSPFYASSDSLSGGLVAGSAHVEVVQNSEENSAFSVPNAKRARPTDPIASKSSKKDVLNVVFPALAEDYAKFTEHSLDTRNILPHLQPFSFHRSLSVDSLSPVGGASPLPPSSPVLGMHASSTPHPLPVYIPHSNRMLPQEESLMLDLGLELELMELMRESTGSHYFHPLTGSN